MANQRKRNGILDRIVNPVIDAVDPEALLTRVDLDQMLERVDMDELLARIDIDAVVQRVDVGALIERVDIDAIVQRVDVGALVQRVDVDAIVQRVDVDAIVQRVDVDAIVQRIDVDTIVQRVDVNAIVADVRIAGMIGGGATQIASGALGGVRRQIARADRWLTANSDRALRREPGPGGMPLAGPISRLLAYAIDSATATSLFGFVAAALAYLASLVFGEDIRTDDGSPWWLVIGGVWWLVYFAGSWLLAQRTLGMGIVGVRVVGSESIDLRPRSAIVRALVFPFSFILGLGLVGIVIGRRRRSLHDVVADTLVVSDVVLGDPSAPSAVAPGAPATATA